MHFLAMEGEWGCESEASIHHWQNKSRAPGDFFDFVTKIMYLYTYFS